MIQIYDYTKFYDKKVEVKIDNEVDLIQFLDYLKFERYFNVDLSKVLV